MKAKEFRLQINESAKFSTPIFVGHRITYAGMPSDKIYSLVISKTDGYHSRAYNLFIPIGHREVIHQKGKIIVQSVNSREINFRFERH